MNREQAFSFMRAWAKSHKENLEERFMTGDGKRWYEQEGVERRVVSACNRFHDFQIMGCRHWDMTMHATASALGMDVKDGHDNVHAYAIENGSPYEEQGFVDQWGWYMSREEAYIVADRMGQILPHRANISSTTLFSEMLY